MSGMDGDDEASSISWLRLAAGEDLRRYQAGDGSRVESFGLSRGSQASLECSASP